MIPIISFVGQSNPGKTTLLEKVVKELKTRGYCVAVVKHSPHGFDIDHEGKDNPMKVKILKLQSLLNPNLVIRLKQMTLAHVEAERNTNIAAVNQNDLHFNIYC